MPGMQYLNTKSDIIGSILYAMCRAFALGLHSMRSELTKVLLFFSSLYLLLSGIQTVSVRREGNKCNEELQFY